MIEFFSITIFRECLAALKKIKVTSVKSSLRQLCSAAASVATHIVP